MSHIDRLRELREQHDRERHIDLEVPGYSGLLWCRYAPVPWETLKRIQSRGERLRHTVDAEVIIAADTLVNACVHFLYRDDAGELKTLEHDGEPVTYTDGLKEVLALDSETSRETARAAHPDVTSVVSTYNELMEWQRDGQADADEAVNKALDADPTPGGSDLPPTEPSSASP